MAIGDITRLRSITSIDEGFQCITDNGEIIVGKTNLFGTSLMSSTNPLYLKRITPTNYLLSVVGG